MPSKTLKQLQSTALQQAALRGHFLSEWVEGQLPNNRRVDAAVCTKCDAYVYCEQLGHINDGHLFEIMGQAIYQECLAK